MITLAIMKPGRAASGRRYFRGSDKRGNVYWLMEDPSSQASGWILKVDAGGSMADADLTKVIDQKVAAVRIGHDT